MSYLKGSTSGDNNSEEELPCKHFYIFIIIPVFVVVEFILSSF